MARSDTWTTTLNRPKRISVEPAVEPVTLAEAKAHLHVDFATDDALITRVIKQARENAELYLARALITQTWIMYLDHFPACIEVPLPELQSVTSITYTDTDGNSSTVNSSIYTVNTNKDPGRIYEAHNQTWPTNVRDIIDTIAVTFVCGYGATGLLVPEPIRGAMLLEIGHRYENRESVVVGQTVTGLPIAQGWAETLASYRFFQ